MIRRPGENAASRTLPGRWRPAACAALLVSWCALASASPSSVSTPELDSFAHKAMQTFDTPGMAVTIVDGDIVTTHA